MREHLVKVIARSWYWQARGWARACGGTLVMERLLLNWKISGEQHFQYTPVIWVILLQGLSILKLRRQCLCVRCNFPVSLAVIEVKWRLPAPVFSLENSCCLSQFPPFLFCLSTSIHSPLISFQVRNREWVQVCVTLEETETEREKTNPLCVAFKITEFFFSVY